MEKVIFKYSNHQIVEMIYNSDMHTCILMKHKIENEIKALKLEGERYVFGDTYQIFINIRLLDSEVLLYKHIMYSVPLLMFNESKLNESKHYEFKWLYTPSKHHTPHRYKPQRLACKPENDVASLYVSYPCPRLHVLAS